MYASYVSNASEMKSKILIENKIRSEVISLDHSSIEIFSDYRCGLVYFILFNGYIIFMCYLNPNSSL